MEKNRKIKGRLILKEVNFEDSWKKVVIKNNESSGKVTLPKSLIGKAVYVIVDENGN